MRPSGAAVALGLLLATAGCGGTSASRTATSPLPGWSAVPNQVASISPQPAVGTHADPVRVSIPSIGVQSTLERLGTDAHGQLVPPANPDQAGWYAGGVRPGDPGPAVIAGHVDSRTGPAVFTELGRLKRGAAVVVTDARGGVVRFTVDDVRSYPKTRFPTAEVYGPTPDPQLRLITCGGDFDRASGHYVKNVIVFAVPAG